MLFVELVIIWVKEIENFEFFFLIEDGDGSVIFYAGGLIGEIF